MCVCVCSSSVILFGIMSTLLCADIDECFSEVDGCSQVCTNTEGSFECSCWPGFQVVDGMPEACEGDYIHTCNNLSKYQ